MQSVRSINHRVSTKIRKIYLLKSNNSPYLSGDVFADNADVSVFENRLRRRNNMREIADANVIFCPSNKIDDFFEMYGKSLSAKVLIFGNSDEDFEIFEHKVPKSVRRIYLQNANFVDNRIRCLPIGIENSKLATNGIVKNFNEFTELNHKSNRLLIGPFSPTHPERKIVLENLREITGAVVTTERLKPKNYGALANDFKYIASPRGNGIDTHRFWEAFYRNSIPVVKKSGWSQALAYLQLPYIEVNEWSPEEIKNLLNSPYSLIQNPRDYDQLWWPYWKKLIMSDC
jgi:hypothetical protein